ncbi:MAG: hypothetical protein ACJ74U_11785 [Jatrophihabitantaceae bacterium]
MEAHNAHAGQGPVLLDIGGDIGALVLAMPAELAGSEVEARPVPSGLNGHHPDGHTGRHLPHVGVLARSAGGRVSHTAVFGELPEGWYQLYLRPAGPVALTLRVQGGEVTEASWPL